MCGQFSKVAKTNTSEIVVKWKSGSGGGAGGNGEPGIKIQQYVCDV